MGCSTSKLDNEESVQLCKDRKKFIKQAVEYRIKFASGHIAYVQSMKRVSAALREYVDGDEPREFLLDSFPTPPIKKTTPGYISISPTPLSVKPTPLSVKPIKSKPHSTYKINYLRSGGNPAVAVEERPPQSPETARVEAYEAYSPVHYSGMDSVFAMQSSPMNASSFFHYSPNDRPNFHPPSPQTSQWDFFWNPFSSLDYYGYPARSNLDDPYLYYDNDELRQVREEEGIPELEEDSDLEESDDRESIKPERDGKVDMEFDRDEVIVEDVDESDNSEDEDETDSGSEIKQHIEGLEPHQHQHIEVAKNQSIVQESSKEARVADCEPKAEKPGFTAYVNRRPTSMAEVIKDLEDQFTMVCKSASEVSSMLEASRAQYLSTSNDLTAAKIMNPVALFRTASSRSSSSRFLVKPSTLKDEVYESNNDSSEDCCMYSGSHQSTLDRLYAWEKKLYQEVRAGERIRIAYEKKCKQLKNQDVKGEDPSSVDKTRTAIRDLQTQMKVSIHSVEAVSKRIETLRDEELQPQLLELVQGLSRMWNAMAEGHQLQKRTLDEAKILLAGMPSKTKKYTIMSPSLPHRLARSAANLETELRNWRACFESWIVSQRSYVQALKGWLLRCVRSEADTSKLPFSPHRSLGAPLIFTICIQWSRFLDTVREAPVLEGLDFFAAGVGSLYAQQLREDSRRKLGGSKRFGDDQVGGMEIVEVGELEDEVMTMEKMSEVAIRVLCAGMSVAVSSLTQFSVTSAEGYAELVEQWDKSKRQESSNRTSRVGR